MSLKQWLLDLLYPPKCMFCRQLLKPEETDLCVDCRMTFPRPAGAVYRGEHFKCCWTVAYYQGGVGEAIKRFKYSGMTHYARAFARLIAMQLLAARVEFDVLTWVPVSRKRRRTRGYDQCELLARAVADELGVECIRTLMKSKHTKSQVLQVDAAARRQNVVGAFSAVNPSHFRDKRVLLIDDIITSGATLSECSKTLLDAGAASVECAAIAATRVVKRKPLKTR